MWHWSSGKYSIDYEDEDGKEVNQPTPSLEREEEPADDDEEEALQAVEEEEAPVGSN